MGDGRAAMNARTRAPFWHTAPMASTAQLLLLRGLPSTVCMWGWLRRLQVHTISGWCYMACCVLVEGRCPLVVSCSSWVGGHRLRHTVLESLRMNGLTSTAAVQ